MLEPAIGAARFATIYFVSLLAGSFGALLVHPTRPPRRLRRRVRADGRRRRGAARAAASASCESGIGGLILINLVLSFSLANISVGAHLGGLIGGALAALASAPATAAASPRSASLACSGCARSPSPARSPPPARAQRLERRRPAHGGAAQPDSEPSRARRLRPGGAGHQLGMQDVRQQLEPVDQARPRAREVRRRRPPPRPARAQRGELARRALSASACARGAS